jgi:hypothetical protein
VWVSAFEDDDEALAIWRDEVLCSGSFLLGVFDHLLKVMFTVADNADGLHILFGRTRRGIVVLHYFVNPFLTVEVSRSFYLQ